MSSSQVAVSSPQPVYAPFNRRLAAYVIDGVIALAVVMTVSFSLRVLRAFGVWNPPAFADPVTAWRELDPVRKSMVILAYLISFGLFHYAILEASAWQASVGKRLLRLHVTDTMGQRLSFARSFARAAGKVFFNGMPYVAFVSVITASASSRKQALHDFTARTVVLQGPAESGDGIEAWRIPLAFGMQYLSLLLTYLMTF